MTTQAPDPDAFVATFYALLFEDGMLELTHGAHVRIDRAIRGTLDSWGTIYSHPSSNILTQNPNIQQLHPTLTNNDLYIRAAPGLQLVQQTQPLLLPESTATLPEEDIRSLNFENILDSTLWDDFEAGPSAFAGMIVPGNSFPLDELFAIDPNALAQNIIVVPSTAQHSGHPSTSEPTSGVSQAALHQPSRPFPSQFGDLDGEPGPAPSSVMLSMGDETGVMSSLLDVLEEENSREDSMRPVQRRKGTGWN